MGCGKDVLLAGMTITLISLYTSIRAIKWGMPIFTNKIEGFFFSTYRYQDTNPNSSLIKLTSHHVWAVLTWFLQSWHFALNASY